VLIDLLQSQLGASTRRGVHAGISKYTLGVALFCLSFLLLPLAMHGGTIEHPGILHKEDNCSSCHADKTRGKSVHSAMVIPCTVCHLAQTQGDMTTLQLSLPKTEICFSCHEKTMMPRQHLSDAKKLCVDCHDAHSSNRRMLLRDPLNANRHNSSLMFSPTKITTPTTKSQP
jgi:predicted CXXCH cytochrome family protein